MVTEKEVRRAMQDEFDDRIENDMDTDDLMTAWVDHRTAIFLATYDLYAALGWGISPDLMTPENLRRAAAEVLKERLARGS